MNESKILKENNEIDTLLECLFFLSQYHERQASKEALSSSIAKHGTMMNQAMFIQAAKKIGLISKSIRRDILDIHDLALPAILLLKNDKSAVLLEINKDKKTVKIILPEISLGEITMSFEELQEIYELKNNNIIIIKPSYNFGNRIKENIDVEEPKKWFWSALKKNKDIYILVAIAAIFINIFVLFIPLFTMNVYDRVLPNKAIDTLTVLIIGIFLVLIFDLALKLIRSYFLEQSSKRADIDMSSKIFDQLLNIRLDSKPSSTGLFVSRLQSFETVREFFTSATLAVLIDIPFIFLFIFVIFYIAGPLAYVSIGTVVLAILFSFYMQRPIKRAILNSSKEDQIKQTTLTETVAGLEIIKGTRAQNRMKTHWEKSISQTTYYGNKSIHLSQIVTYVTGFISQSSSILIVSFGVVLASNGDITMGAIIAAMMLNSRVLAPVSQIVGMIVKIDRTILSLNNIDEIMNMPVERSHLQRYLSRPNLNGDIIFKDMDFSYKNRNFKILKNINLKINEGEKVGIIGKIGSGKSTLAKLLLNLYEPSSGSLLIDKTVINQIDPVDLRRSIGYVPQEAFLFMGSVRDNITIGDPYATDEDILDASKIAGLHSIIAKHESGYDLLVGERGEGLSGGERQAITLARAIVSKPKILILDEPTNSMDELSEQNFKNNLKNITQDKTLIVITHKPSILTLVDRLIVLEDGKIIADGPKEKIISMFQSEKTKQTQEPRQVRHTQTVKAKRTRVINDQ